MILKRLILKILRLFGYDLLKISNDKPIGTSENFKLGSVILHVPIGHDFPFNYTTYPEYQRNIPRLAEFLTENYPDLSMIDIGANIGDTAILVKQAANIPMLCIEGDSSFFEYLKKNTAPFSGITLVQSFLGDQTGNVEGFVKHYEGGTMRFTKSEQSSGFATESLDTLIEHYPEFTKAKLLKIDTDGYDFRILRGSKNYLESARPVVFFEYDRQFLEALAEDGLKLFSFLEAIGYKHLIFYDNYGRLLLSADIAGKLLIKQLHNYIDKKYSAFPYYDICAFHADDTDLFKRFIEAKQQPSLNPGI